MQSCDPDGMILNINHFDQSNGSVVFHLNVITRLTCEKAHKTVHINVKSLDFYNPSKCDKAHKTVHIIVKSLDF